MKFKILILVIMLILSLQVIALGAPFDLVNKLDTEKTFSLHEFIDSPSVFDEISQNVENYVIEGEEGNYYSVLEVDEATKDGTSFNDAIKFLTPVEIIK